MSDVMHYLQYKKNKIMNNENSNERYIDDDSIMEYNNRYSNDNPKEIKINNINNNFLFFRSKNFSDKIKSKSFI